MSGGEEGLHTGLREELEHAVSEVRGALPPGARPTVGLILGSGLGSFADKLEAPTSIPYRHIPGFAPSTIIGHAGNLVYGRAGALEVLAMQGRIHYYEGHDLARVAFPARTLVACGCRALVVTNAAGAVNAALTSGEIVIVSDHINLLWGSPLRGPNDPGIGPRFPDMSEVYDRGLRQIAAAAGAEVGLTLREGVYAALPGPSYETPAEVRMLRTLGADMVGMSTVPEAIAARHMGARVLGLSCVTNLAAGLSPEPLSHEEVTATADRVRAQFEGLLAHILAHLAKA
jgi:purine-nucleoside phosphorylase